MLGPTCSRFTLIKGEQLLSNQPLASSVLDVLESKDSVSPESVLGGPGTWRSGPGQHTRGTRCPLLRMASLREGFSTDVRSPLASEQTSEQPEWVRAGSLHLSTVTFQNESFSVWGPSHALWDVIPASTHARSTFPLIVTTKNIASHCSVSLEANGPG